MCVRARVSVRVLFTYVLCDVVCVREFLRCCCPENDDGVFCNVVPRTGSGKTQLLGYEDGTSHS